MSLHFCRYVVIKKSIRVSGLSQSWLERCRCGRLVDVSRNSAVDPPLIKKCWYDRNGNLERITGDGTPSESAQRTSEAQPEHATQEIEIVDG